MRSLPFLFSLIPSTSLDGTRANQRIYWRTHGTIGFISYLGLPSAQSPKEIPGLGFRVQCLEFKVLEFRVKSIWPLARVDEPGQRWNLPGGLNWKAFSKSRDQNQFSKLYNLKNLNWEKNKRLQVLKMVSTNTLASLKYRVNLAVLLSWLGLIQKWDQFWNPLVPLINQSSLIKFGFKFADQTLCFCGVSQFQTATVNFWLIDSCNRSYIAFGVQR